VVELFVYFLISLSKNDIIAYIQADSKTCRGCEIYRRNQSLPNVL